MHSRSEQEGTIGQFKKSEQEKGREYPPEEGNVSPVFISNVRHSSDIGQEERGDPNAVGYF